MPSPSQTPLYLYVTAISFNSCVYSRYSLHMTYLNSVVCTEFEKQIGLPRGIINKVVSSSGTKSAWAQMERGDISVDEFGEKFSDECSAAVN